MLGSMISGLCFPEGGVVVLGLGSSWVQFSVQVWGGLRFWVV